MKKLPSNVKMSIFILLMLINSTVSADIAIIAHPDNSATKLELAQVKAIYLGKSKHFPDGQNVSPVDQKDSSEIQNTFSEKVLGKNQDQLKVYWSKLIFTGKAVPPKILNDDSEVKNWVAKNPASVGYINASAVDDSVKLLLIVH